MRLPSASNLATGERAVIEQAHVCLPVFRVHAVAADETVEIVEPLVVAGIDHDAAVRIDDRLRTFMLEPAEGGAFHRQGRRIKRVDLDDPAEPVRFIRFLVDVPAPVDGAPSIAPARQTVALVISLFRMAFQRPDEVIVEVLLRHQIGAPRGNPAGAVVDGAEHLSAGRVGGCFQPGMTGGGAGKPHRRGRGDAACVCAAWIDRPTSVRPAGDFDDRSAMRRHLDFETSGVVVEPARKHDAAAGEFVIHAEQTARGRLGPVRQRDETEVVVIVAELPGLPAGRLLARLELGGAR